MQEQSEWTEWNEDGVFVSRLEKADAVIHERLLMICVAWAGQETSNYTDHPSEEMRRLLRYGGLLLWYGKAEGVQMYVEDRPDHGDGDVIAENSGGKEIEISAIGLGSGGFRMSVKDTMDLLPPKYAHFRAETEYLEEVLYELDVIRDAINRHP